MGPPGQNTDCWYLFEPPRRGGSNEYPQSMFLSRNKKNNNVYPSKPHFYYLKWSLRGSKLYRHVFVMIEDIDQPVSASLGVFWIAKGPNCLQVDKEDNITKTCLYYFDPLKPHFYIVKLGFTGVYIIFLISSQNIDCGTRLGGSYEYPHSMFWAEIWKISAFFYLKFFIFWCLNFQYIWTGVF